jgi:hypothetical protein
MRKLFSLHHLQRLFEKPDYQPASGFSAAGLEAVYIDNEPYRGNKTTVFAWLGLPELKPGEQCPAMVLLHAEVAPPLMNGFASGTSAAMPPL